MTKTLQEKLRRTAKLADPSGQWEAIVDELRDAGVGIEAVRPILVFMEENPQLDLGSPGPLVHFVEKFFGAGYEAELLSSLARRPTLHTVWMLNRVINGTKIGPAREGMIYALRKAAEHPAADRETIERVAHFTRRF